MYLDAFVALDIVQQKLTRRFSPVYCNSNCSRGSYLVPLLRIYFANSLGRKVVWGQQIFVDACTIYNGRINRCLILELSCVTFE